MFKYNVSINTVGGDVLYDLGRVNEQVMGNGVVAVYVDAKSQPDEGRGLIDPEKGVLIDVTYNMEIKGCMANCRSSEFWCSPYFSTDTAEVPDETQFMVLESEDGNFVSIVPVVNDKYKSVIKGKDKKEFSVRCFSWCDKLYTCKGLSFVYAVGKNPMQLVENCVKEALKLLNNGTRSREERRYPELFEYLGWCSWDSMQIRVSEDGLTEKCEEFKEKNIPVKWAILDDMWAEVRDFYGEEYADFKEMSSLMHRSALWHFEADPKRFPNGLKGAVSKIKEYGLDVGVWYPTTGYWRGIDSDGEAYRILKDYLIETHGNVIVPDWHVDKSYMYYKTVHDFLRKCGADFVKIDNQSMTRRYYKGMAPVGRIAKEFHDGMEASVGEHFDNRMINCMGMGSEDMWSRTVSPISRTSGDFKPENREWFKKHILQCAYNSILQGQFYWCDWDMWWTDDGQAAKNSLMRAVSGGPVYVSDMIGRSNREILAPLSLDDGRVLRCDRPGVPTSDCITSDHTKNGKALKIQNIAGEHGILAVLNIDDDERAVTAQISGDNVDGFEAEEYAVYEHFTRDFRIMKKGESFNITLASPDDYKLYIFAPITDGFAVIGRTDKFISPKTVEYVHGKEIKLIEDGPYAYFENGGLIYKQNKASQTM